MKCKRCDGSGKVSLNISAFPISDVLCPDCNGSGVCVDDNGRNEMIDKQICCFSCKHFRCLKGKPKPKLVPVIVSCENYEEKQKPSAVSGKVRG